MRPKAKDKGIDLPANSLSETESPQKEEKKHRGAVDGPASAIKRSKKRRSKHAGGEGYGPSSKSIPNAAPSAWKADALADTVDRPSKRARHGEDAGQHKSGKSQPGSVHSGHPGTSGPSDLESTYFPPALHHITMKHEVLTLSVISSTKMEQKVKSVLQHLRNQADKLPSQHLAIVVLRAKAAAASKMISIVEIAKKEMKKNNMKCWQYSRLEGIAQPFREKERQLPLLHSSHLNEPAIGNGRLGNAKDVAQDGAVDEARTEASRAEIEVDASEEDEEAFEPGAKSQQLATGATPKKVRKMPFLTIYLCRLPVPDLKARYGEQKIT